MDGDVMVQIPVSAAAAEALRDQGKVALIGRMVTDLVSPATPNADLLRIMIAQLKADAHARGLTDDIVDAELAAHKAERRR